MQEYCIRISSNICFGYLVEAILKYPKHMFYEEIRIKIGLSNISWCPLRILYNSKFIGNKCCRCNEGSLYLRAVCISLTTGFVRSRFIYMHTAKPQWYCSDLSCYTNLCLSGGQCELIIHPTESNGGPLNPPPPLHPCHTHSL